MCDVEEMSTEETALLLGLQPQTVRTRLHRARMLLRRALQDKLAAVLTDISLSQARGATASHSKSSTGSDFVFPKMPSR